MKKVSFFILLLFLITETFCQTFVSTVPENKNVILEEIGGVRCGPCADGHKIANEFEAANPGDVVLINIHAGGYAAPASGYPNYTTSFGEAILNSSFGFWYYYNKKQESNKNYPKFGDQIQYKYNVKTLENKLIYSEEELSIQNYFIDQQELFSGLRQGLKLMKQGEVVTFIFPSQIAYGYYGDNNKIGRNQPLICKVTLIKHQIN